MAHDPELANRLREVLSVQSNVTERRMFGGLAFLIDGNMAVAASGQGDLMVRVGAEDTAKLVGRAHVSAMEMAGREIRGWVRVADAGIRTTRQLQSWVQRGVDQARSLPPK